MAGKKESFLLVSLNEDKAKELAQAVSSDTCRKVLNYLADHDATESEIASTLKMPISTVHYNLQQLMKGGLVVAEEFHYSEKGKEVNHYKLANKYIIIAPKSTWGLKEKLKNILPIGAITLVASFAIAFATKLFTKANSIVYETFTAKSAIVAPVAERALMDVADYGGEAMLTGASAVNEAVNETINQTVQKVITFAASPSLWQNTALWFLIGGVFVIITFLVFDWIKRR
ncbi:MAG: winged helix-turn-helix domain-containing protein [archaeon]